MIQLRDIAKVYPMGNRELEVLRGVNLHIKQGEMVAIMGPSGSGKTTMLNLIGCLDVPTRGSYYLENREVSCLSRGELAQVRANKIGFIFQSYNLLPQLSALANVELGMKYAGGIDSEKAMAALARVGLSDRANHKPSELSGGEQQRVSIARALVKNPPLILADEPTGNLDSHTSEEIMAILTALHNEQNNTLVMITHEADIAHYCQHIIHFKDGRIEWEEAV
ncbi:MAG: ABC transporter ATP-binding protein [Dehalococcoidales bacterium]|nr:ABC transporter ATP-binding protein [Dehalococcoidales bacterium]